MGACRTKSGCGCRCRWGRTEALRGYIHCKVKWLWGAGGQQPPRHQITILCDYICWNYYILWIKAFSCPCTNKCLKSSMIRSVFVPQMGPWHLRGTNDRSHQLKHVHKNKWSFTTLITFQSYWIMIAHHRNSRADWVSDADSCTCMWGVMYLNT